MDDISQEPFADVEFLENPEPRCPCILLLDTSGSMSGRKIDSLNQGLQAFAGELQEDSLASKRVEVAIVTFGPVNVETEFTSAIDFVPPYLETSGATPMGEAISKSLELLDDRKSLYKQNGISYYRPWIFMITDGEPTDSVSSVVEEIANGEESKKFMFFAVGVDGANMDKLSSISSRAPLKLKGLAFTELFSWLSSSLSSVSRSNIGDSTPLENPTAPDGWAVAG